MKRLMTAAIAAACLTTATAAWAQDTDAAAKPAEEQQAEAAIPLDNEVDQISYIVGAQTAQQFTMFEMQLNPDVVKRAIEDVNKNRQLLLTEEEMMEVSQNFQQKQMEKQQEMMRKQQEEMTAKAGENKKAAEEFLAENAKRDGIKTTESGLQYMVLKEGTGDSPTIQDEVRVHYHGKLMDDTVFDSSIDRGQPITLSLNRVIEGWQEAIPMMKEGARWRLFIPPDLGYGDAGAPPDIPPGSLLIFDVELIDVINEDEAPAVEPAKP
jgi:FKBP-type peptidyl-prolyl cis-trans isomerase